jgi:hypothetical protein
MYVLRAFLVWLIIIAAESVNGAARELLLAPVFGANQAKQIGFLTGAATITVVTLLFIRWINARSVASLLAVGALWVFLTAGFEFALGMFVLGYPLERMMADYDILRGGLMLFGLVFLFFIPLIARLVTTRKGGSSLLKERKIS